MKNVPTFGAYLYLASMLNECQVPWKKMPWNNWNETGWYAVRFSSWP